MSVLATRPPDATVEHCGLVCPRGTGYRDLLITGPPASGKSALIRALGAWPMEGTVDLARPGWWHGRGLTFRPREVHLALPWVGRDESLATFYREIRGALPALDASRIRIPPARSGWLGTDWRRRYLLVFLLPGVEELFGVREARARAGDHAVDAGLSPAAVAAERAVYEEVARLLAVAGMRVCVAPGYGAPLLEVTG